MYKSHIKRTFKNKYKIILLIFLLVLPSLELTQHFYFISLEIEACNPNYAFFLCHSTGHLFQRIFIMFLPLFYLALFGDDVINDYKTRYYTQIISRVGVKKYYREKFSFAFITPFIITVVSLLINLGLCHLFFKNGTHFGGIDEFVEGSKSIAFVVSMKHPLITDLLYTILAGIVAGLCTIIVVSISMVLKNKKSAYPLSFIIWYCFYFLDVNISNLTQPFLEIKIASLAKTLFILIAIACFSAVSVYLYEVKFDEVKD